MAWSVLGVIAALITVVFGILLPSPWGGIVGLTIAVAFIGTTFAAAFDRPDDTRGGRDQSP